MDPEGMDPYGQSLRDFQRGDISAKFVVRRDDGFSDEIPTSVFFSNAFRFFTSRTKSDGTLQGLRVGYWRWGWLS